MQTSCNSASGLEFSPFGMLLGVYYKLSLAVCTYIHIPSANDATTTVFVKRFVYLCSCSIVCVEVGL